jgi:hypothetical protein
MTVTQLDQLQRLARRIDVTRLAILGLGTDDAHQAVEDARLLALLRPRAAYTIPAYEIVRVLRRA